MTQQPTAPPPAGNSNTTNNPVAMASSICRYGVPVTIQATEEAIKAEMPHNSWLPDYRYVTEGRQVGYALRETGEDLIFVRFPLARPDPSVVKALQEQQQAAKAKADAAAAANGGGDGNGNTAADTPTKASSPDALALFPPPSISSFAFTIPRRWLVPVKVPAALAPPMQHMQPLRLASPIHQQAAEQRLKASTASPLSPASTAQTQVFAPVGVTLEIRPDGKPILCVVCGAWESSGEFRRSGYKCGRCIGVPSNPRLKAVYDKIVSQGLSPDQAVPVAVPNVTVNGLVAANSPAVHAAKKFSATAVTTAQIAQARREKSESPMTSAATTGRAESDVEAAAANTLELAPSTTNGVAPAGR